MNRNESYPSPHYDHIDIPADVASRIIDSSDLCARAFSFMSPYGPCFAVAVQVPTGMSETLSGWGKSCALQAVKEIDSNVPRASKIKLLSQIGGGLQ